MTNDPKVLAGLQQAFNASDDPRIHRLIGNAWELETASCSTIHPALGERIRAWTPPASDPSLEQRVAELEDALQRLKDQQTLDCKHTGQALGDIDNRIKGLYSETNEKFTDVDRKFIALTHPEPPAPVDPVCARSECGHRQSEHTPNGIVCQWNQSDPDGPHCYCHGYLDPSWLPAPAASADLDPVRVEADAITPELLNAISGVERFASSVANQDEMNGELADWLSVIRAYLNGETR